MKKTVIAYPIEAGISIYIYEKVYDEIGGHLLVGPSYKEAEWVSFGHDCDWDEAGPFFLYGGVPYFLDSFSPFW